MLRYGGLEPRNKFQTGLVLQKPFWPWLAAQPGRFECGCSAPYGVFISGLMYLKTQKLHELKKYMKRFWILKINWKIQFGRCGRR